MKLILNRREEKKGLIFKKPIYHLDIDFGFTEEDKRLIKKHAWKKIVVATQGYGKDEYNLLIQNFFKPNSRTFRDIGDLCSTESQIIESAKKLKNNLEVADDFSDSSPREIAL